MSDYLFSLYGRPVKYRATSPLLVAPVNELLKHFRRDFIDESAALSLCFRPVQDRAEVPWMRSSSAQRLSSGTGEAIQDRPETGLPYEVFQDGDRLVADFHNIGVLMIDGTLGKADGYVIKPESMRISLIEYLFHTALIHLLKRNGLYSIHATALEKDGRGVLIPGMSGRGKTTSFISLLRSGYRYLSDDHPLIRDAGTHVELLPFPTKINVTESTIAFFPELKNAPDGVLHAGSPKRSFYAEDIYPTAVGGCCKPAMVLFPYVIDASDSHLERLPKSRALEVLLSQSLLVYDQDMAIKEFKVLAKLVQEVDCYRLHFGRDILALPELITPLLEKT